MNDLAKVLSLLSALVALYVASERTLKASRELGLIR